MRKGLKHLRKSGAGEHSRKSSLKNLIIAQEAGTARGSKLPLQFLPDTSDAERGNDQARRNVAVFQLIEIIFIQPYHFLLFIRHTGN
jgi:hypothetical protein